MDSAKNRAVRAGRREAVRILVVCLAAVVAAAGQAPIDLNRATAEELEVLPSIGPVMAKRIVEHRRKHGPFRRAQDVVAIRGLSVRRYRQIAHLLTAR